MSQIIKAFTGIFIVLFMMCSALGILGVFFQTLQAQDFHALIVNELENSNYAEAVVENAFITSQTYGYELEIRFYQEAGEPVACGDVETIPENLEDVCMAQVTLQYPVEIAFFQVDEQQTIIGYAR
ncbi:MAG: hypothetical protein IJ419_01565 [Agathobacter sp.]|nr:hypothetical protein [Agathobacter sp.]